MGKFSVFSGFLGSGKTTAMMALTKYYTEHHAKAAMISNDLGDGVTLADHQLAELGGANATQITDECICFCHDVLTAKLNAFYNDGCELVVSDIPGFGVGALEHVYHGLSAEYPGEFELGPFTVLTEPRNVKLLQNGEGGDMAYILRDQLLEADLIVLNKRDLLTPEEAEAEVRWLTDEFPQAQVIAISALKGEGLEEFSQALKNGTASMQHPDIDYDDDNLGRAMDQLTEYYLQYRAVVCCNTFDGTEYLLDMANLVKVEIQAGGFEIPHMKLLAWEPEGDYGKVDLLGVERPIEITRRFERPCTAVSVLLNANAACPADKLKQIMESAVGAVSHLYQLDLEFVQEVCFNMGE